MATPPTGNQTQNAGANQPQQNPAGNQQNPQTQQNTTDQTTQTPEARKENFTPNATTGIDVRAVNPPLTPDQLVGVYNTPTQLPALPTLKLQDVKTTPVKNKTIQSHLRAIESKMIATEKLMKDIVKLQRLQILTEKEVNERRRELYQNTFEEYLLDKTIDFGDKQDPDCTCINLPKVPTPPGGGFDAQTPETSSVPTGPTSVEEPQTTKKEPKTQPKPTTKPTSPGTPTAPPSSPRSKPAAPNYPWWDPRRYIPQKPSPAPTKPSTTPHRPGQKPGRTTPAPVPKTPKAPPHRVPPIVEPAIPAPEPGVQPVDSFNNIRRINRVTSKTPVSGVQYRAGLSMGTKSSIGAMLGGFALNALTQKQIEDSVKKLNDLKNSNPDLYKEELNNLRLQAKQDRLLNPIMEITGAPGGANAALTLKALGQLKSSEMPISIIDMFSGAENKLTPDLEEDGTPIKPKASGGINDIELYSSTSQNYFKNISNQIASSIPLGPHTPLPHPGYVKPQGNFIPRPNLRGMPNPMGKPMPWGWQPTLLAGGAIVNPVDKIMNWWNKGRNIRVPNESKASWKTLMNDDRKQLTRTNKAFKEGATGLKGWRPLKAFTPEMVRTGPTPAVRQAIERPLKFITRRIPLLGDMISPQSTSRYDQLSGPNAYYNNPASKSVRLESAQSTMVNGNKNKTPTVVPLPPDYIKIPGKKAPSVDNNSSAPPPGVNDEPTIFSTETGYYR